MFLALLPLVVFLQVMPPPAGQIATAALLRGTGGGRDIIVAVPAPTPPPALPAAPEGEDCHCGVPSSPRGPR